MFNATMSKKIDLFILVKLKIIWKIIKSFDVIYEKSVAEILQIEPDTQELPSRKANPHPAIEHFLSKLRH